MKTNYKILGVGHPRTGTGYTASLLNHLGFKVGHEKLMDDGIVAWQMLLPFEHFDKVGLPWVKPIGIKWSELSFDHVIYNVRNPKHSIPSILGTENCSSRFRSQIADFTNVQNRTEQTIASIIGFDSIIKEKYKKHLVYRVEDQANLLRNYLLDKYSIISNTKVKAPAKNCNTRKTRKNYSEPKLSFIDVRNKYLKILEKYCIEYGYDTNFIHEFATP